MLADIAIDWTAVGSVATGVGAIISALALLLSYILHKQTTLSTQRQNLLPLWNFMESVKDIDVKNPNWHDVETVASALELVALCWEGKIVDQNIIRRTFRDPYISLYDKLKLCVAPPDGHKSGPDLISNNPASTKLYLQLLAEKANQGALR